MTRVSIRSSAESSKTTVAGTKEIPELGFSDSSPTVSPPPNFKPPQPNSVLRETRQTLLSLGYSASLVPKSEFPPDNKSFNCPFCRKVREIVAVLDLDVLFYPSLPKKRSEFPSKSCSDRWKAAVPLHGPQVELSCMKREKEKGQGQGIGMDPNTGVAMYESDDIIKYLVGKYATLTEGFAMIGRMGKGSSYTPSKLPSKPLELWAYEVVLVAAQNDRCYMRKLDISSAPSLEDPNAGVQMFESAEIIDYLRATYAL
ncbi:unnamed protein product [Camellia sinensis]